MTIAETSTVIASGIAVGSASIVISRVTCSRMPPSLTPGDSSAPSSSMRDVGLDLLVEVDLLAVEVHEVAADRVALLLLDDDGNAAGALDLEVEEGVALADEEPEVVGVGLEGRARPPRPCRRRRGRARRGAGGGSCGSRTRCARRP